MLTLYGFQGSRAIRIAWLLEELKVPYELQLFPKPDLGKGKFPKSLKEHIPTGEVPALKLENGTVLTESAYIVQYLMEKYGQSTELAPHNEHEREQINCALYTAEGNIMSAAIVLLVHKLAVDESPIGVSFLLRHLFAYIDSLYATTKLKSQLQQLSEQIKSNGNYLVGGHLTAADIMYGYDLEFIFGYVGWSWDKFPVLSAYYGEIEDRPAFKAAQNKLAGPPNMN